jgi:hypothetical protein
MESCKSCVCWFQGYDKKESDYGFCRRFPPNSEFQIKIPYFFKKQKRIIISKEIFPLTYHEDWCGEFSFKREKNENNKD